MELVIKYIETIEELSKSQNLPSGNIDDFTKEILKKSCETLGCERSNAWLLKSDVDELHCIMSFSRDKNTFESSGILHKEALPIYFKNLLKNEIIVSNDAVTEPINFELVERYLEVYDVTAMIDVPLRSEGKMIGVICFEHVNKRHEWTNEEMKFTQSVAQLLSLALETKEKIEYRDKLEKIIEEKEILISEINHRVKNNMTVIVSLLNLQKSRTQDDYHADLFEALKDKVFSMSMVQEQLHMSESINKIDFSIYIENLVKNLNYSYGREKEVSIDLNLESVNLDVSRAIPCGLIANEALTNSFKYAFEGENLSPEIQISLQEVGQKIELKFSDNGVGFDPYRMNDGMGLDLIKGLAEQVDGEVKVDASGQGVIITLLLNSN